MVVFLQHRRLGTLLFILTLMIGAARIAANVHYPLDVISGLILGVTIGLFCDRIMVYARYHHPASAKKRRRPRR